MANLIKKAIQIRNDEMFICSLHQYCELVKEYKPDLKEIAFSLTKEKCEQSTFGYTAIIEAISDGVTGDSIDSEDYIEHFDNNKRIYNRIYIGTNIYNKLRGGVPSVLFVNLNESIYKNEKNEDMKFHQTKVINIVE